MNCTNYLAHVAEGEVFYIGLPSTNDMDARLQEIGFKDLVPGEAICPDIRFGPVARFNAQGKELPQKHLKKETAYRQHYWEWKDWNDNSYSRVVDIPYQRYPRLLVAPPSIELVIVEKDGQKYVLAGGPNIKGKTSEETIIHKINLMLEIFGRVEILQENLNQFRVPEIKRLNWDVLPPGKMPWKQFKRQLDSVTQKLSQSKQAIINERFEVISKYEPDFHAFGTNGYRGYVIFGFTELGLYVFESMMYGNATYVFEGDWETLSQMTKAEILTGNLHKHRFIHREGWTRHIEDLLNNQEIS